jgi:hypothetical protein
MANIPAVLQNIPFIWVPPFLVALLLPAAVGDVLLTRRGEPARQGLTRRILIVASLTLFFSLCSCTRNALAGFSPISAHGNTLSGFLWGSLFTPGFLGFLVGMIVALIGSMITLRSKR